MFHKGDVVRVKARVRTTYSRGVYPDPDKVIYRPEKRRYETNIKVLTRQEMPEEPIGIVIGHTIRQTGYGRPSGNVFGSDWELGYLKMDKSHRVILVEPLGTDRWLKPWTCLPEDLSIRLDAETKADAMIGWEDNDVYPNSETEV